MAADIHFRQPAADEMEAVSHLVRTAFADAVALDWSEQACATFSEEASPENLQSAFEDAFFGEIGLDGGDIVGVILLPSPRLIALTFVSPSHWRRGIASEMLDHAVAQISAQHREVSIVCLNATRHATPFYASRGFFPISPEFTLRGTVGTRMALWLPVLSLA